MKTLVKALVIGLVLAQTAQAEIVRRVQSDSEEGKQIFAALKASPDTYFKCTTSYRNNTYVGTDHLVLSRFLEFIENYKSWNLTQYNNATPLFDIVARRGDTGYQVSLFTNAAMTEVTQVVERAFNKVQVNKGTLAQPKLVFEDQVNATRTCKKAVLK